MHAELFASRNWTLSEWFLGHHDTSYVILRGGKALGPNNMFGFMFLSRSFDRVQRLVRRLEVFYIAPLARLSHTGAIFDPHQTAP